MSDILKQYEAPWSFTCNGITKQVYSRGRGPDVVILHEVWGLDEPALKLGITLSDQFRVHMPVLFGEPGEGRWVAWIGACIRREIFVFAARRRSPVVDWLRELCREVLKKSGREGAGVIGMCITGGFALTLVADAPVLAPVVAQASIPLFPRRSLGLSPADQQAIKANTGERGEKCVLALRYAGDCMAPKSKVCSIEQLIGKDKVHYEAIPGAQHSTLTSNPPSEQALATTRDFLARRLGVAGRG